MWVKNNEYTKFTCWNGRYSGKLCTFTDAMFDNLDVTALMFFFQFKDSSPPKYFIINVSNVDGNLFKHIPYVRLIGRPT